MIFDSRLSFREHIQEKIEKAYKMLGIIKRNFIHISSNTFILLYTSIVRPHLDYGNSVWHPYKVRDIEDIEKVQKGQPSWSSLKKLPYKGRLEHLHLVTLKYRRQWRIQGVSHGAMALPNHHRQVFNVRFLISFHRYFWIRLLI